MDAVIKLHRVKLSMQPIAVLPVAMLLKWLICNLRFLLQHVVLVFIVALLKSTCLR